MNQYFIIIHKNGIQFDFEVSKESFDFFINSVSEKFEIIKRKLPFSSYPDCLYYQIKDMFIKDAFVNLGYIKEV